MLGFLSVVWVRRSRWPIHGRDDLPNNFVGDLVHTERGWVAVPPTCCPDGHDYSDSGWSVSSVWCMAGIKDGIDSLGVSPVQFQLTKNG